MLVAYLVYDWDQCVVVLVLVLVELVQGADVLLPGLLSRLFLLLGGLTSLKHGNGADSRTSIRTSI